MGLADRAILHSEKGEIDPAGRRWAPCSTGLKLDSFKHLYMEELRDLYDSENQLLEILPAIAEAAVLAELKEVIAGQIATAKARLKCLESILINLNATPTGNPCKTMSGLIAECNDVLKEERKADPGVLEAALIARVQKLSHFQIAGYGCARTFAAILREADAAATLQKTLNAIGETNKVLNRLALRSVNGEAVGATDERRQIEEAVVAALEAAEK